MFFFVLVIGSMVVLYLNVFSVVCFSRGEYYVNRAMTGILLIALVLLAICHKSNGGCEFPSFLQSRSAGQQRREWHSHIEENSRESENKWSTITHFYSHVMRTTIFGGKTNPDTPKPYTRDCLLEISPGRFLCVHKDQGEERGRFLCVSFVQRSADVMQLQESRMSDLEDPNLCTEEMTMDKWPYINKANFFTSFGECHLQGGFSMKLFDKTHKKGVCTANDGETRLESECSVGDGISFRFRHSYCVPKGLQMHKNQQTFCMASWTHGLNTFSVLRSDRTDHVWCFVHPTVHGRMFNVFLFRDLYCETDPYPWQSTNYISIDLQQDPPRSLGELCVNDYEGCEYWTQPCRLAGSVEQLTCAKMCGICTKDERPKVCSIPTQFQGNWVAKDDNHKHKVTLNDKIASFQSYSDFHCVQWEPRFLELEDTTYTEQMFVTTFDNGCRPRYSCAQLKKHSPSILRYRLSEHQLWPFENTNGITVDCSSFKYKDPINPLNHYHSRHFQTIISETERIYVDCKLGDTREFDAVFDDGTECEGELTQEGLSTKNKMKLILKKCPGHQSEQEFACLDSSKHGYLSEQLMVTETLDSFNRIRCWLFPVHPALTFYLLPIEECNEGANEKIATGIIRPLSTFREQPKLKLSIIVENAIEEKPNRAESVRNAPYLTENGQGWHETENDHEHDEFDYNDQNTKVNQQRDPIESESRSSGAPCRALCRALYVALLCSLICSML